MWVHSTAHPVLSSHGVHLAISPWSPLLFNLPSSLSTCLLALCFNGFSSLASFCIVSQPAVRTLTHTLVYMYIYHHPSTFYTHKYTTHSLANLSTQPSASLWRILLMRLKLLACFLKSKWQCKFIPWVIHIAVCYLYRGLRISICIFMWCILLSITHSTHTRATHALLYCHTRKSTHLHTLRSLYTYASA